MLPYVLLEVIIDEAVARARQSGELTRIRAAALDAQAEDGLGAQAQNGWVSRLWLRRLGHVDRTPPALSPRNAQRG